MHLFRKSIVVSLALLLSAQVGHVFAQPVSREDSVFTSKTFPLISLMSNNQKVQAILKKDRRLKKLAGSKLLRVKSYHSCEKVACYADQLKWTDKEITLAGDALIRLFQNKKAVTEMVSQLRDQNFYPLYESEPDTVLLRKAWMDAALGMNRIFDVYIRGEKPRYAKIDSISFEPGDTSFKNRLQAMMQQKVESTGKLLFYELSLCSALQVLEINGRQEAVNFEPLRAGQNHEPLLKLAKTNFDQYTYSMILIPGLGPEIHGQALDPGATRRCEEGVARYKKGLAPFIVVSGGNVHPFRTPFNEAVEMKKYIVEKLGLPADVVFIEPHARHTTTNLRNTSRMIYRLGFPQQKPVLVVTDSSQAGYIAGRMSTTALRDLNYLPFRQLKLLNDNEVEFYTVEYSLQADPFDPLDP